ncbi:FAD binding domain-containing protein [Jackrogersella minutella]|nr:FAD binding domain-containing protein [Jackrogersella minutella]
MLTHLYIQVLSALLITSLAAPTDTRINRIRELQKREDVTGLANVVPAVDVHTPSWPQWVNETTRWSSYSAPTFDLIFIPNNEQEISDALVYLSSYNFPFFTQGGGHGYSTTLATIQNAVMIKMERFDYIRMNDDMSATVGGGVRYGALISAVHAAGREMTVGSCVCVGSTGAMLGGGHGRLQGKHGLGSDALRSVRMVLWNGTMIEASKNVNSDLFWGMRGAGHNFGVVIESTYETFPQENDGMHYTADMVFTDDSLESVVGVINSLMPDQDPALAIDLIFFANTTTLTPIVFVNLVYAGPQAEGQRYADLFASANSASNTTHYGKRPSNSSSHITRLSIDASEVPFDRLNNATAGGALTAACATGSRQNTYSANLRSFDVSTIRQLYDSYGDLVKANPLVAGSLVLFEVFGQKAIQAKPDDYSAYPNRRFTNTLALLEMIYTDDSVGSTADTWAREWRDTLAMPDVSGYEQQHVYENYAHGDEPLEALYGYDEWRKERLTRLKNEFDPKDNFDGYHNIPLEGGW